MRDIGLSHERTAARAVSDGDHRAAVDDRIRARRIAPRPFPRMLMAHRAAEYATVVMVTGALITGFTVLSAFTATRVSGESLQT